MLLWLLSFIPTGLIWVFLIAGFILFTFAQVAPDNYKFIFSVLGLFLIAFNIFFLGVNITSKELQKEIDAKNTEIVKIKEESKHISQQTVIKYVTREKIIKEKGDEVIKYVSTKNDADCSLHNSTIELLNSSAKGDIPDPARATDETGSRVNLSAVTEAVVENNNKYHQVVLELTSLQEWVKAQKKNNE
jgi:energy-coupling factor transporter transmembrane protein EcfT